MTKSRELRRKFDAVFKREAIWLWETRRAAGVPIGRVANELGLHVIRHLKLALRRSW